MGWDAYLLDPVTGKELQAETPHHLEGSTYCVGGTCELWLAITYNYSPHYFRVIPGKNADGKEGLRSLDGMRAAESLPILAKAIEALGTDTDPDYWKPTEGNARQALEKLRALASMRPDGVWRIT